MEPNNNKLSAREIVALIIILICIILAGKLNTFFLANGLIY